MKRNIIEDKQLESILARTEFPGEDESAAIEHLRQANIPERVIQKICTLEARRHKMKIWGVVAAFGLFFLLILGANEYIVNFFVFIRSAVSLFIIAVLGAIFLIGITGVICNINYARLEHFFRDQGTRAEEFFHRVFRP